jgi:hypothetical protein
MIPVDTYCYGYEFTTEFLEMDYADGILRNTFPVSSRILFAHTPGPGHESAENTPVVILEFKQDWPEFLGNLGQLIRSDHGLLVHI